MPRPPCPSYPISLTKRMPEYALKIRSPHTPLSTWEPNIPQPSPRLIVLHSIPSPKGLFVNTEYSGDVP